MHHACRRPDGATRQCPRHRDKRRRVAALELRFSFLGGGGAWREIWNRANTLTGSNYSRMCQAFPNITGGSRFDGGGCSRVSNRGCGGLYCIKWRACLYTWQGTKRPCASMRSPATSIGKAANSTIRSACYCSPVSYRMLEVRCICGSCRCRVLCPWRLEQQ